MTKTLIIGQGIAGTLLSWSLQKLGKQVQIWDGNLAGSASIAAAGIINPVTGKRFVKSWRFDEFYPVAKAIYQTLEKELGIPIWEERPTLRLMGSIEEANDWSIRCAQADYVDHLSETKDTGAWADLIKPGFRFGYIQTSARANLPLLVTTFRQKAIDEGMFSNKTMEYQEVETQLQAFDHIVFCEGWNGQNNPYFPEAQFRVSKGSALIIRFLSGISPQPTEMLKKTLLLTPIGKDSFWVGSTYEWQFEDPSPSPKARRILVEYLEEMLDVPFEVVDHVAGIRPTMVDRRPFVARSALNPKVYMFNGLGTKGALLGPFFAQLLAAQIHNCH